MNKRIIKTSIKDQVYELIKEKILLGEYSSGQKINMLSLANELGVSNTPVREALSKLESEGLVEFNQNAGPQVVNLTPEFMKEIEDTIRILLIGSYDLCRERGLIDELIINMEEILLRQIEIENDGGNEEEFIKVSIEFDESILKSLNNQTLYNLYSQLFNLFYLTVRVVNEDRLESHKLSISEHKNILEAIKKNDRVEVGRWISVHYSKFAQ